jgi:hypothetical protein
LAGEDEDFDRLGSRVGRGLGEKEKDGGKEGESFHEKGAEKNLAEGWKDDLERLAAQGQGLGPGGRRRRGELRPEGKMVGELGVTGIFPRAASQRAFKAEVRGIGEHAHQDHAAGFRKLQARSLRTLDDGYFPNDRPLAMRETELPGGRSGAGGWRGKLVPGRAACNQQGGCGDG